MSRIATIAQLNTELKRAGLPAAFRPKSHNLLAVNCSNGQLPDVKVVMARAGREIYRVFDGVDTDVQATFVSARQ